MDLIRTLEQEEIARLGKNIPEFAPGDTVIVSVNVVEGNRKRVQAFEGVVIAKRNRSLNSSFVVRKISSGEGVDERLVEKRVDREVSIGDYVTSGGELPAMVLIDCLVRRLPGSLNDARSSAEDSFSAGLLDWPHYTRPEAWKGAAVPEVLMSGNHAAIARWRRKQALGRTWERRPELVDGLSLSKEDRKLLDEYRAEHPGK